MENNWLSSLLSFVVVIHLYLAVRFAVRASFKYASVYSIPYMLLVIFVPFIGYYIASKKLDEKLQNLAESI